MKQLIIVNGTMGVGKTTTCKALQDLLQPGVFLDGDWCWDMKPFIVSEENKRMVLDNIGYLLRSFLKNTGYEYVTFCWVIDHQKIMDDILKRLEGCEYALHCFSLVCSEQALKSRILRDVNAGLRNPDTYRRSVSRVQLYDRMQTEKIDVSERSAAEAAEEIFCRIQEKGRE